MGTPFEVDDLYPLLRRSINDAGIKSFFGETIASVTRDEHYGELAFRSEGIHVIFKEAPWVVSPTVITDPKELYLCAFHFFREGYEGFSEYSGRFPNGVAFGDSKNEILRKMGKPRKAGGGDTNELLGRTIPDWFQFAFRDAFLHFQFDANGTVDLVTLSAPKLELSDSL